MTATRAVSFPGPGGGTLAARLELPERPPAAYAILAHCFTCSKDLTSGVRIARELAARGIAALRFDFTGIGESEGAFERTNFSSNVADLEAAAAFLAREYEAPGLLVGHSLGGTAVLHAASRLDGVRAVATINAPYSPSHAAKLFAADRETIEREGQADVRLGENTFTITRQLLEDLEQTRMRKALRSLRVPMLILHALADQVVGVENASQIFTRARHPKSFIALEGADHLLSDASDAARAGHLIAAWAADYLGIGTEWAKQRSRRPADEGETEPPELDAGEGVILARIARRRYRTEILAGGHPLTADEPAQVGGTDTGPSPYDYLGAALGACTAMTLRMYADRKGWPLEDVAVRIRHSKVHAADERVGETRPVAMDRLDREVELEGTLDAEQRARLLEIADRCPVHRTLVQGVSIGTTERTP